MEKLNIKEIEIHNFKTLKKIKLNPNSNFNIIIGKNNIGKSTIFEAILLWEKCYLLLIQSSNRKIFYTNSTNRHLSFKDLDFIRIIDDKDLFFGAPYKTKIILKIANSSGNIFNLGISLEKPSTINNSSLRVAKIDENEFLNFATYVNEQLKKLDEIIFIYQTRPISNILQKEPFFNIGKIKKNIEKGLSQEVLRNKIVNKEVHELEDLERNISNIINEEIKFSKVTTYQKRNDEFITLNINNKDLYLQGSGILQIIEILSTINYVDAPLNILLVDEPDSHIHNNLQTKLMEYLKSIENNQTFVITHNDSFVNTAIQGEVFYLNEEIKEHGNLLPLELNEFDLIKNDLGGIIMGLTKINNSKKIIFVEGNDDAEYLLKMITKYISLKSIEFNVNELMFFHLRGKDYFERKIENIKRILGQIFNNKSYMCIYDKDFTSITNSNSMIERIKRTLGGINSKVLHHNGYCIESTIFSDLSKLTSFLIKQISANQSVTIEDVGEFVQNYKNNLISEILCFGSDKYNLYKERFRGQKNGSRPELDSQEFDEYLNDISDSFQFVMNKITIKEFIEKFEEEFSCVLFDKTESTYDFYVSQIFNLYINSIIVEDDFCESNKETIECIING